MIGGQQTVMPVGRTYRQQERVAAYCILTYIKDFFVGDDAHLGRLSNRL